MILSAIGWAASILYLANHYYLSAYAAYNRTGYFAVNLIAALGLVASSAAIASWQPVFVNAIWAAGSLYALWRPRSPAAVGLEAEREGVALDAAPRAAPPHPAPSQAAPSQAAPARAASLTAAFLIAVGAGSILSAGSNPYAGAAALGWAAAGLFAAAYVFFAAGAIGRRRYLFYNILAAWGMTPVLFLDGNWPVFAMEAAWGAISLYAWRRAARADEAP